MGDKRRVLEDDKSSLWQSPGSSLGGEAEGREKAAREGVLLMLAMVEIDMDCSSNPKWCCTGDGHGARGLTIELGERLYRWVAKLSSFHTGPCQWKLLVFSRRVVSYHSPPKSCVILSLGNASQRCHSGPR